jgi:methyl acetate hydrolase
MTYGMDRRRLLKGAASMMTAATLGALMDDNAHAATARSPKRTEVVRRSGFASVDQCLQRAVDDRVAAGVVAMGATQHGLVYEGSAGATDIRTGEPIGPDSVFWLASMTKAITATACMQLVEQGKLQLEQPAADILPQLKAPPILEGFDASGAPILRPSRKAITVRHLLTHTSGYTYSIWSEPLSRYEKATSMPDIGYSLNGAFAAPLEFEPGERWQYGISMDWVGKLVEAVTDQSLEVYFREHIFEPLDMHDTGFLIGSDQKRRVATMHRRQPDGLLAPEPFEMNQRPEFFMGGGGLFSTPRDYMAFLQMLLNDGAYRGERLLHADTVATMFRNHIGDIQVVEMKSAQPSWSNSFDQFPGQPHKWGLSFDINVQPGPHGRSAGSVSWAGMLNSYFWLDPVKRVAGSLFTQTLPFYDARIVDLYGQFEERLYEGLRRA